MNIVILKIYRGQPGKQYWEEFELPRSPYANIISCLMEIQKNPVNRKGEKVEPVVWEQGCLEEVCGSCSMLINGRPRQACTALVEPIIKETGSTTITLAPFTKFPLVRDLIVDRSAMFENLKKVSGWIETDGSFDRGPGPKISQKKQEVMYALSRCMTCGCCVEACPQMNSRSAFVGPQVIAQAHLFNLNPTGAHDEPKRLTTLMGKGGLADCGNAQNCVKVCPKDVPLTDAIAAVGRSITKFALKSLFE
ncbi:MAG: succinate dehydrogenase iron-sulfur subunit [Chlamydiia bacterium]|nr:succinate dehydrogenase iron-sulfur subunit [Chlamydiia bacterium]